MINKTNKIYHFLGKEFVARQTSGSEGFVTFWVAMGVASGDNNFVATIAIASLCSLVTIVHKRRKRIIEKHKQTETKFFLCNLGPSGNKKQRFQFHVSIKRPCW